MKTKLEQHVVKVLLLTCWGVAMLFISGIMPTFELGMFVYGIGAMLTGIGVILIFSLVYSEDKKVVRAKRGAMWIWAVCLLSIGVLALGWFVLMWPTYMIIQTIEGAYNFPPEATGAIGLIKTVIAWFLILMALGLLLWAFVSSQRREEITYPVG
jgi:hypothetical protein